MTTPPWPTRSRTKTLVAGRRLKLVARSRLRATKTAAATNEPTCGVASEVSERANRSGKWEKASQASFETAKGIGDATSLLGTFGVHIVLPLQYKVFIRSRSFLLSS